MFSCFNPDRTAGPKCEWQVGNLRKFVSQYNEKNGTTYVLSGCLDVPTCGMSPASPGKQPEVLVTGANGERPMVIERKHVVPESYAKHHANQHLMYETIPSLLIPHLHGDLYALKIADRDLLDKTKCEVQKEALAIAQQIIARADFVMQGQSITGNRPIDWQFGRAPELDRDDSAPDEGVGVVIAMGGTFPNRVRRVQETRDQYEQLVSRCLVSATAKFKNYAGHIKLVVLEFYGDFRLFDDDDAREIVQEVSLPNLIDQVWNAIPEWISESDYEIGYQQIR